MTVTTVKKKKTFRQWLKGRKGQQVLICIGFMFIPLLLLFVFTYLPFGEMVQFSFYKMKYATPVDKRVFVGWKITLMYFKEAIVLER